MSIIYLESSTHHAKKNLHLFMDDNYHLVVHKILLTVGFQTHPNKKKN